MLTVLPLKLSLSASQKPFYLWKSHHNYLQSLAALLRSTSTPLCVQMISLGGAQVSECPPNHQHQHCWVQFRNWFLRLCGLRRPILFLLDTSKYYNLIFTHLSIYIPFMAFQVTFCCSHMLSKSVCTCDHSGGPCALVVRIHSRHPRILSSPTQVPYKCPVLQNVQRPMRTPAVLLIATSHLLRNP